MRATQIKNGVEVKHAKRKPSPEDRTPYLTPPKTEKLAKKREFISKRRKVHAEDFSALLDPASRGKHVRTLNDVTGSASKQEDRLRGGGINRMRNHR